MPDAGQHLDVCVRHRVVLVRRRRLVAGIGGAEDHQHGDIEAGQTFGHVPLGDVRGVPAQHSPERAVRDVLQVSDRVARDVHRASGRHADPLADHRVRPPRPQERAERRGEQGPEDERLRKERIETRAGADQHERPHQVRALFGERGCDVATAGVPDQGDVPQPEVVEQHSHAACLLRHVVRRCGRGLPAPRKVDPDDVMVAAECPDHRAPRGARSSRSVNEQQRRRLPRAIVDHMHPVRVRRVVIIHARDDTRLPAISLGQMSAPRSTCSRRAETSGT